MSELTDALKDINKQWGAGSIFAMNETSDVEGLSTGCMSLDLALGGKGLPKGRIVEIFGTASAGKTTLALHAAVEAQREGNEVVYIDAEHALDPTWAKKIGINFDHWHIAQPTTGEEALFIAERMLHVPNVGLVVVDSVASLVPKAELAGEFGDSHIGLQARLMSQGMRKLTGVISKSKAVVIFINQIREKVGVLYGSPEVQPGGRALKFYSSIRLDIRPTGQVKDGTEVTGQSVRVKVVKNKVATPFKEATFDIMYDRGISREGDLLDAGVECGVLAKRGSWIDFGENALGNGRDKARSYLKDEPGIYDQIFAAVKEKMK